MQDAETEFDAWNPGLNSEIPERLMPLVTLFCPENATVDYKSAKEAADFCGLEAKDMTALRIERLIVHELLIRVTVDLSVPDGPIYEELGINLRGMTAQILDHHIRPEIEDIRRAFEAVRQEAEAKIQKYLEADIFNTAEIINPSSKSPGFLQRLFGKKEPEAAPAEPVEITALARWQAAVTVENDPAARACLRSLIAVVGGIVGQRGRLIASQEMVTRFALNRVCNTLGSEIVGKLITPIIAVAAKVENYRFLPAQEKPFFMNVKGSSAAGKSTIRPQQRRLARKLNIPWEDFALISPDYWRKFLLDYDSLGADYKYAAVLTGLELEIIDKKLDRYIAQKAALKAVPHLLIDRFRFDSFASETDTTLLTRYSDTVYLFFIITPPAATVERAWKRGLETGRYKAVEDLLYHNIEAYTGMPHLFFSWIRSTEKKVHFEFLNNDVPYGNRPKTVAFGWNEKMTILDLDRLNDIDRFRNLNIDATMPSEISEGLPPASFDFLKGCISRIPEVTLANRHSLEVYGHISCGKWLYKNIGELKKNCSEISLPKCLAALGWDRSPDQPNSDPVRLDIKAEKPFTLGAWGEEVNQDGATGI